MADANEEKVQVQVTATPDDFNTGMQAAVQQLTAAIGQMNSLFSGLAGNVTSAMSQTASAVSHAASDMSSNIKQSAGNISSAIDSIKNVVGAAGIGIVSAFGSAAKSSLEYERSLMSLSRTSGLTIESASKLAFASSQYGMTADDLSRNVGILSRNLSTLEKNADSSTNVFNRYQIAVEDANGKLLPTDQILMNIADRFKSMPNGVEKTGLAMQVFGRSGQQMIPMLNQGSDGLQKMGITAEKLGLVMKDTSALTAYMNAQKQWTATLKGLEIQMGNAVLPVLTAFSKAITSALQAFNELDPGVRQTIITVTSVTGAVAAMTLGWGAATAALTTFGGPFASVGTMMSGMPNLITGTVTGIKSLIVGMADATIAVVKYVATGGLVTTAHTAMNAAMAATSALMATVRTAVLATSVAFSTGGISSIVSYGASLISMNSIIAVARTALMLLYGTVTAGIAVVVALAIAWTTNFGNIQEATAGICDGISYGLNNFSDGISQWASGIAHVFASLAKAIANAFVGDFQGAWDAAKGMGDGIIDMAKGFGKGLQGVGQAGYAMVTNIGGTLDYFKASGGALLNGAKSLLGFGNTVDTSTAGSGDNPDFSAGNAPDKGKESEKGESPYEIAKQQYAKQAAEEDADARRKAVLWQQYLADVEKTQKEAADYQINLAKLTTDAKKEQIDIDRATLEKEIAQGKAKTLEAYDQKISLLQREVDLTKAGSVERIKAETAVINAQKEKEQYMLEIEKERQERLQQHKIAELDLDDQNNQHLKEIYAITEEQLTQLTQQNEEKRYQIKKDALEKALQAAKNDQKEQEKIKTQLLQLEDQYVSKRLQYEQKMFSEIHKNELNMVSDLAKALDDGIKGIIKGTSSVSQLIRNMGSAIRDNMLSSFTKPIITSFSQSLSQMLGLNRTFITQKKAVDQAGAAAEIATTAQTEASKTALVQAGGAANTAITSAAAATATATAGATTAANMSMLESIGTALSSIPWYGWVGLAILSGVASARGGSSTSTGEGVNLGRSPDSYYTMPKNVSGTTSLPSFDVGSWQLPEDTVAKVHKDELIVPAKNGMADNVRNMISGKNNPQNTSGDAGEVHIHNYYSAIDGKGMKKLINKHSRDLADSLNTVKRSFYKP